MKQNICPYEDLDTNVQSSFICESPNLETTQMSLLRCMDKQTVL